MKDTSISHPCQEYTVEIAMDGKPETVFRKARSLKQVGRTLERVAAELGLTQKLREHTLVSLWPAVAGQTWSCRSRGLYIDKQGNFVVAVADAATAQELSLMRAAIVAALQKAGGALAVCIKDVRFDLKRYHSTGSADAGRGMPAAACRLPEPREADLARIRLSEAEATEIERLSSTIEAAACLVPKERLISLLESELKLRRWRRENGYPLCCGCGIPLALPSAMSLCPPCRSSG